MGGTNFFGLFHSLDKGELSAFGKYLRTAHANKKITLQLFGHLSKSHPLYGSRKQWKEDGLAGKLFGTGRPAQARKQLQNALHDLYLCLRDFLVQQKAQDGSLESEWLWLSILRQRDDEQYRKSSARLFSKTAAVPKTDTLDYLWDMAYRFVDYSEQKKPDKKKLQELSLALDGYYSICRSKIDCELLNQQKQDNADKDAPPAPVAALPRLTVYRRILQLYETKDGHLFQELMDEIRHLPKHVSQREMRAIWTLLKNYCQAQTKDDNLDFAQQAHALDKFASERQFFLADGEYLTELQFLNVTTIANLVGELAWARAFVKKRLALLAPGLQAEAKVVAEAMILFKEEKFQQAMKKLESFDEAWSREEGLAFRRRAYLLMCLYETGDASDRLERELDNFYRHLQRSHSPRQKIVRETRKFLLLFNHLLSRKKTKERLLVDIKAANPRAFKNWLLQKADKYTPIK